MYLNILSEFSRPGLLMLSLTFNLKSAYADWKQTFFQVKTCQVVIVSHSNVTDLLAVKHSVLFVCQGIYNVKTNLNIIIFWIILRDINNTI